MALTDDLPSSCLSLTSSPDVRTDLIAKLLGIPELLGANSVATHVVIND
jgi:hypothetical protein